MLETRIEDQTLIVTLTNGKTNSITRKTLDKLKSAVDQVKTDGPSKV